jgi:hypothetical protein
MIREVAIGGLNLSLNSRKIRSFGGLDNVPET